MDFTNSITICQASATFCTLYKGQKFRYLLHSSRMRQNFNRIITADLVTYLKKNKQVTQKSTLKTLKPLHKTVYIIFPSVHCRG